MADNVAITAGSGTSISAAEVTTLNGATVPAVEMQRVKVTYGTGAIAREIDQGFPMPTDERMVGGVAVAAFPAGFNRVTDEPHQLFYDPFDAALDTTNRWNAAVSAGGGVAAAVAAGNLTLGTGTTANGYSYLLSQPAFTPTVPAWLGNSWAIQIEAGATAGNNATRFWGHGQPIGTPTGAAPFGTGNAYGFELDAAGVLQAVVYAGGTRTAVASLAALQPTDGAFHRYICYYRTDKIYWYIDGLGAAQLAASSNFQGPQIQTLPVCVLAVAGATPPAASRVFTCSGMAVWDTGKNNIALSDGAYPWRKVSLAASSAPASETAVDRLKVNAALRLLDTAQAAGSQLVSAKGDQTSGLWVNVKAAGAVTQGPLTKGVQNATGVATQDLKDSGRTHWSATTVIAGVTVVTIEALVSLVPTRAGVSSAAVTSQTVTAGKRLRITSMTVGFVSTAAAVLSMRFGFRTNPAGAVTATSPLIFICPLASGAALAQAGNQYNVPLPDGLEFAGNDQFGVTQIGSAATGTCWVTLNGFEY